MKALYFSMLAVAVLLASCAKEALTESPEVSPEKTYLNVGLTPQSKTYMDSEATGGIRHVYWSTDDKISVNGNDSDPLAESDNGKSTVTFALNGVLTQPYHVLYPASSFVDYDKDLHTGHINLPAVQTYKSGSFADEICPMAAFTESGKDLTMVHLCSILQIKILRETDAHATAREGTADKDKIVAVRFSGNNNEQVCGNFAIDFTSTPISISGSSSSDSDKVVSVAKSQSTSTSTPISYYIVVPAGVYSKGFSITVKDANGHKMVKSTASARTLEAGKLYPMKEFEFVPGDDLDVTFEIDSPEKLIAFANAYNSGEFSNLGDDILVASVTADIAFDDEVEGRRSSDFNATKGIGLKKDYYGDDSDTYFNGIFNGNNHTISGLKATVPLFKATNVGAIVKDFTIDNTCSFTFTHSKAGELDAGAVIGYHRGSLNNVKVEADVSLAAVSDVNKVTALGGLVGRIVVGSVENNCNYSGNITVPDEFVVNTQKTYIGGLVGNTSNAGGMIISSDFEGTIDFAGIVASTSTTDPYLYIGGIIGNNLGSVTDCNAKNTNTKAITMDNDNEYTATIQNHSRKVYHMAQGGIAGQNSGTVSGCTNSASIKNFVLTTATKGGSASNNNSRYYDLGGVVGLNLAGGTVTGCTNSGLIESRSTPRIQKVGGVVGYNFGTISTCTNDANGDISFISSDIAPYNLRVGEVGGVIGNNKASTVSNISNAGDITIGQTENTNNLQIKFGGVIGFTDAAIDGGEGKTISNSGNILNQYNGTTITGSDCSLRFGGIVGSAEADVKNVTNSGNVTYQLSQTEVMSRLYMGGIVGEVNSASDVTVSGCTNSGEVYFNVNDKDAAHTGNYFGGIVGHFTTSASVTASISSCTNSGYIHSNCNGSTATVSDVNIGGIAGTLSGSSSITISGCNNNASKEEGHENDGKIYMLVGSNLNNNIGGILGYSQTDFTMSSSSQCTNNGYVLYQLNTVINGVDDKEGTSLNAHIGGLVGSFADDKTASISGTNNGEVFFDVNGKGGTAAKTPGNFKDTFTAGILAKGSGASLSDCTNSGYVHGGNSVRHNGSPNYVAGIVAHLTGSSQISNCRNSGNVSNTDNNNTDTIGSTPLTGGIAGYVEGTSESSITIGGDTGCTVNATIIGNRGWVGGAIAYAKYAAISKCTIKQAINCAARQAGGVIGRAENCTISSSKYEPTSIRANNAHDHLMGGIAARIDDTTVDGCYSYVESLLHTTTPTAFSGGGAIVGVSGSGNTIQNCRYKSTINDGAASIAGDGSFSGSGNTADL